MSLVVLYRADKNLLISLFRMPGFCVTHIHARTARETGIKYVRSTAKGASIRTTTKTIFISSFCVKWSLYLASAMFNMKRIILLVVLVLHSILLYTDYTGSGVTAVNASSKTKETNFFSTSSRYFQFEKGNVHRPRQYHFQFLLFSFSFSFAQKVTFLTMTRHQF